MLGKGVNVLKLAAMDFADEMDLDLFGSKLHVRCLRFHRKIPYERFLFEIVLNTAEKSLKGSFEPWTLMVT